VPVPKDKMGEAPFSVDANLLHTSSEGKVLEDPAVEAPDYVYQRTVNPEDAPDQPEFIEIGFDRGDPVALNGRRCRPRKCSLRSTIGRQARGGAARPRRGPLCRHEVPRHLRDARRHVLLAARRGIERSRSTAARRISRTS
jgi:argininosuccinate synthase